MMRRLLAVVVSLSMAASAGAQFKIPKKLPHVPIKAPGLFREESPVTTKLTDAVTEISFLDDFDPIYPRPLPAPNQNGTYSLDPGAYAYLAESYCLRPGAYGPDNRELGVGKNPAGYIYAPLEGPKSELIKNILRRSVSRPDVDQKDIQVLLWAIIARADLNRASPRAQQAAEQLMTQEERRQLDSNVLTIPAELKKQLLKQLRPQLRASFQAEEKMRTLFSKGNATFAQLEKIAVPKGDPIPQPGDRSDIPRGRWSYHPAGYFVRFKPTQYSKTAVEIYVPEEFEIDRDEMGRITAISDFAGSRVEIKYESSGLRSIRFLQENRDPFVRQDINVASTNPLAGLEHLIASVKGTRASLDSMRDLTALASLHDSLLPLIGDSDDGRALLNEIQMAWQSEFQRSVEVRKVASLIPLWSELAETAARGGRQVVHDPADEVAVPGEEGRQRLGQSGRHCSGDFLCQTLGAAAGKAHEGIKPRKADAASAITTAYRNQLDALLKGVKNQLCDDPKAQRHIDSLRRRAQGLKSNIANVADAVNNNAVLKGIENDMRSMMHSKCDVGPSHYPPCEVPRLAELSESARKEENRNGPDVDDLNPITKAGLQCLTKFSKGNIVSGGPIGVRSGFRSPEYQRHLYHLFENYVALLNSKNPNCKHRLRQLEAEMRHHLVIGHATNPDKSDSESQHPKGLAIDIDDDAGDVLDTMGSCCDLFRRYGSNDPVHFEPCPADCSDLPTGTQRQQCEAFCHQKDCPP